MRGGLYPAAAPCSLHDVILSAPASETDVRLNVGEKRREDESNSKGKR